MLPASLASVTAHVNCRGKKGEHTRLDVSVCVRPELAVLDALLAPGDLVVHQRLLFHGISVIRLRTHPPLRPCPLQRLVGFLGLPPHRVGFPGRGGVAFDAVLVHGLERLGDAQHQLHELLLGEAGVVDEVGVDGILQVPALVVGQDDVDGLGAGVVAVGAELGAGLGRDTVVDRVDDVGVRREEAVGLDLLESLGDGLLAEGAADLLQGEELGGCLVLDEVDVGEAALYVFIFLSAGSVVSGNRGRPTSPRSRRSLKLRLLILSCGELGKQHMQSVKV